MAAVGLPSQNLEPDTPPSVPPCLQVMLVGDSGVGKTCLLVRFKDGAFLAGSFISTVGIDFRVSARASALPGLCQVSDGFCRGVTERCSED
ncbi:hypothetical protein DV515_00014783 [Chloebia gouldiae]|uniref:RAB26, member RAS oncogene family n=1 Tax=Chloebia gouldiae TaxID=44316 RepID=A0A3L8RXE1_CHLGU|nr:hypothetical protein DV515_00014783 [Chloebia gouldiae]